MTCFFWGAEYNVFFIFLFALVFAGMAGLQGTDSINTMTAIDEMKESVKALTEMFRLPPETDFLIYRILKDYRGDFKQASAKIFEGTKIFLSRQKS